MSLKRNVVANYFASGWAAIVGLAFVPIYIRYLGIEAYALIGLFATLQVWFALLDIGVGATVNRELARMCSGAKNAQHGRDLLKSMEVISLALACFVAALVLAVSPLIATQWLNAETLTPEAAGSAIALMGFVIAAQSLGSLYRNALLGLQRQLWLSAATATWTTVRAVGSVGVLVLHSPTISAFFVFQLAVSATEALCNRLHLHRSLPPSTSTARFSSAALLDVWRFAAWVSGGAILATALMHLDKVLLAKLLPLADLGYFMLASAVAASLSIFTIPVHNVAYPRFAKMATSDNEHAMSSEYHRFAQLLSIGVIPAGLVLSLFSEEIVLLWTGDSVTTRAVAPLLRVWVIGTTLNSLMYVPYLAQLAHGWTKLSVVTNTIAVLIMIPLILILVPRHGAIAAAWIWVALNAAYVVFTIPVMHSRILRGETFEWYVHDVLAPLGAGSAAALTFKMLFAELADTSAAAYISVAALSVFGVCALCTELGRRATAAGVRQLMRR